MKAGLIFVLAATGLGAQTQSQMDALLAAMRPVLPFPAASPDGEVPVNNSADAKWFVVWPTTPGDMRIVVKANPLHPETQRAGALAMDQINAAVAVAERKAQAAYDKAMEQLRRTGKGTDIDTITLDDEGIAGERIDAELEAVIELQAVDSFDVTSGQPPVVAAGSGGPSWVVTVPANTYRGRDGRDHYRAAETRLYFGVASSPTILRKAAEPLYHVAVPPADRAFVVTVRGNEALVKQLVTSADWSRFPSQ